MTISDLAPTQLLGIIALANACFLMGFFALRHAPQPDDTAVQTWIIRIGAGLLIGLPVIVGLQTIFGA